MYNAYLESFLPKVISEISRFAIFMIDPNGNIATWNKGCELMKLFKKEDVIGKNYSMLFPDFLIVEGHPEKELEIVRTTGKLETENWRRKKTGELFWAHILLTKVTNQDGQFIGYIKITQDDTVRKKYEDELRRNNDSLIKINKELDSFIYTASHDLKAPINNIEGLTTALETELKNSNKNNINIENITFMVDLLKQSSLKFKKYISEMASIAKTHSGKDYVYLSFKEVVEEIKGTFFMDIKSSKAVIEEDFSKAPTIKFSKNKLKSILHNLISNALKYRSPENAPVIKILTKKEDGATVIEVYDNGIGIKEEDKQKIFSVYERLDNIKDDVEGTGVGLAIVAKIIDWAGGRIEVESTPGEGSLFRIFLY